MRKLLVICLFAAGCASKEIRNPAGDIALDAAGGVKPNKKIQPYEWEPEQKVCFNDLVEIISGFYRGQVAVVKAVGKSQRCGLHQEYDLQGPGFTAKACEEELTVIKKYLPE